MQAGCVTINIPYLNNTLKQATNTRIPRKITPGYGIDTDAYHTCRPNKRAPRLINDTGMVNIGETARTVSDETEFISNQKQQA